MVIPVIPIGISPGRAAALWGPFESGLYGRCRLATTDRSESPPLILLADALDDGRLRSTLIACGAIGRGRMMVLAWDDPRKAVSLLRIPRVWVSFPLEGFNKSFERVRAFGEAVFSEDSWVTPSEWPPSLRVAVSIVWRRSTTASGPSPPGTIGGLARLVPCDRTTLGRAATRAGVDLLAFLRVGRVRWIRRRWVEGESSLRDLAVGVGYSHARSVRRSVRDSVGLPLTRLGELSDTDLGTMMARCLRG